MDKVEDMKERAKEYEEYKWEQKRQMFQEKD